MNRTGCSNERRFSAAAIVWLVYAGGQLSRVAPHVAVMRLQPGANQLGVEGPCRQGAVRESSDRADPERGHGHRDAAWQAGQHRDPVERERREVFERVAVREDQPLDPVGVRGGEDLRHRPAGVVTDQRHPVELKGIHERGDQPRDARRREVRTRVERGSVRAHRPVGHDAAEAALEPVGDALPELSVHQQAVHEEQRVALASIQIGDLPLGKHRGLAHGPSFFESPPVPRLTYRQYVSNIQAVRMSSRTQTERSQATKGALVAAARRLFAERGYADVGTEEIVREAGVTRGALYHHFAGKRELLAAVHEQIESELAQELADVVEPDAGVLETLQRGVDAFLDRCLDREVQQIVLLDAPAVLGWERWREIGARYGLGLIEALLGTGMEQGEVRRQPVTPLAHALLGALDEVAMFVARAEDPRAARREVGETLRGLVRGLAP